MKNSVLKRPVTLFIGAFIAVASVRADNLAATANIAFHGTSTLHDFHGTVASQPFQVVFAQDSDTGQMTASASVVLSVQDMSTNNPKRDKNMFEMLDLDHFKKIEGKMDPTVLAATGPTKTTIHLKIRDEVHDVTASISNWTDENGVISCTVSFPVSLKAFKLKAPSVMGVIRVGDTVTVECAISGKTEPTVAGQ